MNKKQGFRQVLKPIFVNANKLPASQEDNTPSEERPNNLQEKLDFYRDKAKVANTEKSTRNWISQFEEFHKKYNYNL